MSESVKGWRLAAGVSVGMLAGLGVFTFGHARGASYLSDEPAACAHCHVMQEQMVSWRKASHHAVAVCNDCHMPQETGERYWTKVANGIMHSWAFTTGRFEDQIHMTARNRQVTEDACRNCHTEIAESLERSEAVHGGRAGCVRCHAGVGHL